MHDELINVSILYSILKFFAWNLNAHTFLSYYNVYSLKRRNITAGMKLKQKFAVFVNIDEVK